MKKFLVCLLIVSLIIVTAGCSNNGSIHTDNTGNTDSTDNTQVAAQMDIAALKASIIQQFNVEDSMDLPKDRLLDMYGFALEDIKTSACYITMGGAFIEEIILVETIDAAAAERIVQKLETKLSDAKSQAQNYDAETYAMLQDCKVQKTDTYVALFISGNAPTMQQMFDDALK